MAVELATAYISLVPSAKGIGANIAKEIGAPAAAAGKQAGEQLGNEAAKGAKVGVGSIVGAIGGVAAVKGAFDFLGDAVSSASDLNETVSKAQTVFGPAFGDLDKWSRTAATSIGQSRQQALDAAGSFGNLFTQLGIGSDQAAGMSQQMVNLASDFASFHNADISDVLDAQQAAFRGEYDSLQRFVPTINAAAVEQEALAETGKKSTKELTDQEKALAVQALMLKGAGKATGDFARTSDGLANKQRIQAAQWADLKAKIGNGLLPVISKLTGFIVNTLAPGMEKLIGFISRNKALFVALGIGIMAALVPAFIAWAAAAIPAAAATLLAAAPVIALGVAVAALALLVIKNWDTIKAAFGAAVDFIKRVIGGVASWIGDRFEDAKNLVTGAFDGIVDFIKKLPGRIASVASGMWDSIKNAFKAAVNWIIKAWNKIEFKIPGFKLGPDRKSTRLNSSHYSRSRMPSSA